VQQRRVFGWRREGHSEILNENVPYFKRRQHFVNAGNGLIKIFFDEFSLTDESRLGREEFGVMCTISHSHKQEAAVAVSISALRTILLCRENFSENTML